ncbi:MAG: hypothetical protein DWQ04_01945 [Chloroflexi bacterium]|nr:MAG: hypothetical protein DWQ04_01945 [Chloroflexota bacterium]
MLHRNQLKSQRIWISRIIVLLLVLGGVLGLVGYVMANKENDSVTAVFSSPNTPTAKQLLTTQLDGNNTPTIDTSQDDQTCILCHQDTDGVVTFASGEEVAAVVDTAVFPHSAHGDTADKPLGCTSCHDVNAYQYPHEPITAPDYHSYQLAQSEVCTQCHVEPHLTSHPGLESETAVVCTDCHGSHEVLSVEQIRTGETTSNCIDCHTEMEVQFTDGSQLTDMIQHGLFASRYETTEYCLACHTQPDLELEFENGDMISVTIDDIAFHDSVHGLDNENAPLECASCHADVTYPHEPVTAVSPREYSLEMVAVCGDCHEEKAKAEVKDVHGLALADGEIEAAVCTDCHGAHDTPIPDQPRHRTSETCEQCHSTIFAEYADSVHGESLITDDNPDVPGCIDCHGVHNIGDPTTALFRVRSPELCAECHADENLMTEYDISTEVFDTYVSDFHGTTVILFEHDDPNAETNKAVCYDCHGVHNIQHPDDPEAGIQANLLETCQQCHPDANENFPDSWTSHFQPSLEHNPLVYLVNLFYQIVIPATLGFFGLMVVSDIYRRVRTRIGK